MRFLSTFFAVIFGAFALLFALDNRDIATISLWPLAFEMEMPLFVLGFGFGLIGLIAGWIITWLSYGPTRRTNRRLRKEVKELREAKEAQDRATANAASLPPPPSSPDLP